LPNGARDARARLIHQRFDLNATCESGLFCRAHLR
jgi:hypothetical protein